MIERLFPEAAVLSHSSLETEIRTSPLSRPRGRRPWVSFNFVSSIDGAATVNGRSGDLGNAWDQRIFALMRHTADVIVVGAQTVRAEGYGGELLSKEAQAWRAENWLTEHPPLAIVSASLNLDPELEVFQKAPVRPIVLTVESAPQDRRQALTEVADVVSVGDAVLDVDLAVAELTGRGFANIHSEGGPTLLGTFAAAARVDELSLTVSPMLAAGPAGRIAHSPEAVVKDMVLDRILKADSMLFLRYVRPSS